MGCGLSRQDDGGGPRRKPGSVGDVVVFLPGLRAPRSVDFSQALGGRCVDKTAVERLSALRARVVNMAMQESAVALKPRRRTAAARHGSSTAHLLQALEDYLPALLGLVKEGSELRHEVQFVWANQEDNAEETAMADAWYEVLSVLHLMAMVCLLQANSLLLPRSYGDGYGPRVSEESRRATVDVFLKAAGYLDCAIRQVLPQLPSELRRQLPVDLVEGNLKALSLQALGQMDAGNLGNIFLVVIPALCKEKGSPFGSPDVCQTYGLAYSSLSLAIGAVVLWTGAYNIIRAASRATGGDGTSLRAQPQVISSDGTNGDECTLLLMSNASSPSTKTKISLSERAKGFVSSVSGAVDLKKLFAPSTIAVIVGFVIGGTPLIRNAMIGDDAPLRVLGESAELIGGGAIPSVTLIMGGNLITGLRGGASVPVLVIAGVVAVRYVLLPLLGTALVTAAVRLGVIRPDPLYQFILLLQYAVPPAMNIGTITQLFGVGESECSVIFVWLYALASVAVTVWSAFFMWTLS